MKKKILITAIVVLILLAVLFVPIPSGAYKDGGTREYRALTYKVVAWNRLSGNGIYDETKTYWFPDNFKSIDELWEEESRNLVHRFQAVVTQISGDYVEVTPLSDQAEAASSDRISFSIRDFADIGAQEGTLVEISYQGYIRETYPAQVDAVDWSVIPTTNSYYTGQWFVNPDDVETLSGPYETHMVITQIYADCFTATPMIPLPYSQVKINGAISEKWCVGDQVLVKYENYRCGENKMEADLLSIETSTFQIDPEACYKPVIYLYPEAETDVSVSLSLNGQLTCTYPAYRNGWQVTAAPDGTLTDAGGQTYNYLYWEGIVDAQWDFSQGFCVKGADTAAFLEESLAQLGLTRKEANEFIVYWLPLMEQNPYNLISFQKEAYTDGAKLQVSPAPDTTIRVFMAWQASENYVNLEPQELTAPERRGFTVVEWGGTEYDK